MASEAGKTQAATRKLEALDPLLHPQDRDVLHQKSRFVDHFYELVTESVNPPFSISIDGLWGSGKTTIMQMLENRLNARWKIDEGCLAGLKDTGVEATVLEQLQSLKTHFCYIEKDDFLAALTETIGEAALARYQKTILAHAEEVPYPTFWFNPWKYQDNVVNNLHVFRKFNPDYSFEPGHDFVVHLLLIKEAWEPLYRELIREALKNRDETVEWIVKKVTEDLNEQEEPLPKEKQEFLETFMLRPFGTQKFHEKLKIYPILP
ncbi:MAG: hypothetical protein GY801_30085 [bacterium]|nr:hypothetical protein [bacterium]